MKDSYSQQPLVTIALPCYNHANFIQDAIYSLINQSYENIEIIIIDDGSTDDSVNKIKELIDVCESRFKRFEFRDRMNRGITNTLNEALDWAQGEYWAICSSDDYYHPEKVEAQVNFFLENNNHEFCVTEAYVVSDIDEVVEHQTDLYNKVLQSPITFEDILTFKVHLPITGMYKTKFIRYELNGFDSNLPAEDYDINLKIVNKSSIGIINQKLYYYRSPSAIDSNRKKRPMRLDVSDSHLKTLKKYIYHSAYDQALKQWNFRRFIFFSAYTDTKYYAFKGMLSSFHEVKNITFYKSLFKLIFIWKT